MGNGIGNGRLTTIQNHLSDNEYPTLYVGMTRTEAAKKGAKTLAYFDEVNKYDGKIGAALSGKDVCEQRDRVTKKNQINNGLLLAGAGTMGGIAAACASPTPLILISAWMGTGAIAWGAASLGLGAWDIATQRNTDKYKKEHNIK